MLYMKRYGLYEEAWSRWTAIVIGWGYIALGQASVFERPSPCSSCIRMRSKVTVMVRARVRVMAQVRVGVRVRVRDWFEG